MPRENRPDMSATITFGAIDEFEYDTLDEAAEIDLDLIEPDPNQPRKHFDERQIARLAANIYRYGLIQRIAVRKSGEKFILIDGERRFRALQLLYKDLPNRYKRVPVSIIGTKNSNEAQTLSLIANIQREDLLPIERAEALQKFIQTCKKKLTQQQVADLLNLDQSTVSKILSLNKLIPEIKQIVRKDNNYSLRDLSKIASKRTDQGQKILFNKLQEKLEVTKTDFGKAVSDETTSDISENKKVKLLFGRLAATIKALGNTSDTDFRNNKPQVAATILSSLACLEKLASISEDFPFDLNKDISLVKLKEELQKYIPATTEADQSEKETATTTQSDNETSTASLSSKGFILP